LITEVVLPQMGLEVSERTQASANQAPAATPPAGPPGGGRLDLLSREGGIEWRT
jgi:hypothetical protein